MGMQPDHRSKQVPDRDWSTRGDKVARRETRKRGTPRQSERQGKPTDRRKTNVRRHRKSDTSGVIVRDVEIGKVERPFYARRPLGILKELEKSKDTARGVKGDDMLGKSNSATGEILGASVEADKQRYKVDAESRSESNGEVGYGHRNEEAPKMRERSEGSLVSRSLETEGRDRMNAREAKDVLGETWLVKLDYKLESF